MRNRISIFAAVLGFLVPIGTSSATDVQLMLVQYGGPPQGGQTPQQEDERKHAPEQQRHAQEEQRQRALEQQRHSQEEQRQRALEQQRHAQEEQRQRVLEQQRHAQEERQRVLEQQRHAQEEQRQRALEQPRGLEQKRARDEAQRQELNKNAQDEAQHRQQELQKSGQDLALRRQIEEQRRAQELAARRQQEQLRAKELQLRQQAEAERRAMEEAKRRGDEARLRQLQNEERMRSAAEQRLREEKRRAWQQHQQDVLRQADLQRRADAEYQRGLAEREAHRGQLEQMYRREREQAARERSQAALNERLREENERFRRLREERREIVDRSGQTVIQEGSRTIYRVNNRYFIQHNDVGRFRGYGGYQSRPMPGGGMFSAFVGPDGARVEIETDSYGRPLRRVRILPDGERYVLFENRPIEAGVGFSFGSFDVGLPPPEIDIPREQYIVDAQQASEDDMYAALDAPPVEALERTYSLDEVLASASLRERMRSVNIDTIHFEFGSWDIGPDQAGRLESVAAVIKSIVNQNPREVFLIEGHTDAVGSDVDNISLSDRRAEAVANLLSQRFGVPAENLVTRGYGKQFLLVRTDGPEWRNRRVVIRRITPLLSADAPQASRDPDESAGRYR